ncbi:hydroxylamine oxidation protein HaoB [Methylacidiphilum kamchatkense]|uniref:Hydroxylamine oxidation protein HaoB n=1 Tax=Methylacidiphilum kamchatkense Kam1 TaxID=1202785 RepID=A0A516TQ21_9BACT|nr:hydroxylamine oxidation protein HaoB [Methylacidiphilum kamchatkense]QDQ43342.1 hydroxylamine oxidation protein HaoB [Methylacidiphilum kamchatkense Kam1]
MPTEETKNFFLKKRGPVFWGLILFAGGIVLILQSLWSNHEKKREPLIKIETKDSQFLSLPTFFPVQKYWHYAFGNKGHFWIAQYLDSQNTSCFARVFPPKPIGSEIDDVLNRIWIEAMRSVNAHAPSNALFIGWWDVSQRLKLFTGKEIWIESYDSTVIPKDGLKMLEEMFGAPKETNRLSILAKSYAANAVEGLEILKKALPQSRPLYLCITTEDISNLALAFGQSPQSMGYDWRVFPRAGTDIHGLIPMVMKWVNEKESAGYMIQELPSHDILVWRADKKAKESLLGRLLPLTTSIANPLPGVRRLYQSSWGGYLQFYALE